MYIPTTISHFRSKILSDKVKELEDKIDALIETIQNKNNQISVCQDESLGLKAEMTVVNKVINYLYVLHDCFPLMSIIAVTNSLSPYVSFYSCFRKYFLVIRLKRIWTN